MFASRKKIIKKKAALPIFGMKEHGLSVRKLGVDVEKMNDVEIGYQLIDDYYAALLRATVMVAGSKIITIPDQETAGLRYFKRGYPFVRDPVVTLPDHKLMLYTEESEYYGAKDILTKGKEFKGYQVVDVKDAYFEGGNIFYSPHKKILFHGVDPCGHYEPEWLPEMRSTYKINYYKVPPAQTNQKLAATLAPHGISVEGLELSPAVKEAEQGQVNREIYYHLNCFMQFLPDGRVIILNKEILSKDSQRKMQDIFGKNFIDLAYRDYLTKPFVFNFVALKNNGKTFAVSPRFPRSIVASLKKLQLDVITLDILDARKWSYDKDFAERVAQVLQQQGYLTADAKNLATHIPKNINGYHLDDGTMLPARMRNRALGAYCVPLDKYYSETNAMDHFYGASTGPQCFLADIDPSYSKKIDKQYNSAEEIQLRKFLSWMGDHMASMDQDVINLKAGNFSQAIKVQVSQLFSPASTGSLRVEFQNILQADVGDDMKIEEAVDLLINRVKACLKGNAQLKADFESVQEKIAEGSIPVAINMTGQNHVGNMAIYVLQAIYHVCTNPQQQNVLPQELRNILAEKIDQAVPGVRFCVRGERSSRYPELDLTLRTRPEAVTLLPQELPRNHEYVLA